MAIQLSDIPVKARVMVVAMVVLVSGNTLVDIADKEGWFAEATQPVPDDKWTYGHGTTTRPDGKPVQKGDRITPQRAMQRLNADVNAFANKLRVCITAPLYEEEWSAFLSLAYNIGPGAFCKKSKPGHEPTLIELINTQRYAEACARISEFNHGPSPGVDKNGVRIKGPVLKGLVKRRAAERELCEKPSKTVLH